MTKLLKLVILLLLALSSGINHVYAQNAQNSVASQLQSALRSKQLTVTENLLDNNTQRQIEPTGVTAFPYTTHQTGLVQNTVWNPFKLGTVPPSIVPPFPDTIGQNVGFCTSMSTDQCGWYTCYLTLIFYESNADFCEKVDSTCNALLDPSNVLGTLSFMGIFGGCDVNTYTYETLSIVGGSGMFFGVSGSGSITQPPAYDHLTYTFHFE